MRYTLVYLLFLTLTAGYQSGYASEQPYIPDVLQPWVKWVLHDKEEQLTCPPRFDRADSLNCTWPSKLELKLNDKGGTFQQVWQVYHKSRIALPGNSRHWPHDVRVDGKPPLVTEKDKAPSIELHPGTHTITGHFTWPRLPENLKLPLTTALVTLSINKEKVSFPHFDPSGRLWLKRKIGEEKIENRLKLESFRLINDTIPAQIVSPALCHLPSPQAPIQFQPDVYHPWPGFSY